ncbi:Leucine rich repeat-containing protein [Arenibacter palladensis]|uniref:Leucine rich repeat-containing protein n=1 Tax=Arenibacter palladensis TaxID=237373 RepID=A0A1M4XYN2_9FLAO|nr:DUF5018 domain-containing protein [Arenibacter palladensis]SHE98545.1 Leucine rich repeat-containing protein [Arenibacter palladensis]
MRKISTYFLTLLLFAACNKTDDKHNDGQIKKSKAKAITSFKFTANDNDTLTEDIKAVIDEEEKMITAEAPSGTDVKALKPSMTLSEGAKVSPRNKEAKDFSQAVVYAVTAEDGTEVEYTVTVTIRKSNAKEITSFVFLAADNEAISEDVKAEIDEEQKTVTAEMPFGTNVTALKPNIELATGATVSPDNGSVKDFSGAVEYTVAAEDSSTTIYTVSVNVALSDRQVLVELYKANPDNTLDWDLEYEDISSWEGVTVENDRVIELLLNGKELDGANLNVLPASLGYLQNLEVLNVEGNSLVSIPKEIGDITNLKSLDVSSNSLTAIPTEIGNLINLTTMYFTDNRLTAIPKEIGNLKNLEQLYLSKNSLTSIPSEIGNLSKMLELILSENELSAIPDEIGNLINMSTLWLNDNSLTTLPASIANNTNLGWLQIQNNQITIIPKSICAMDIASFTKDATAECEQ